jgi:hypothetical protein
MFINIAVPQRNSFESFFEEYRQNRLSTCPAYIPERPENCREYGIRRNRPVGIISFGLTRRHFRFSILLNPPGAGWDT